MKALEIAGHSLLFTEASLNQKRKIKILPRQKFSFIVKAETDSFN